METLVVVSQHRNQAYRRGKAQIYGRFDASPSLGFKEINCRTFQSSIGLLPSPPRVFPSYGSTLDPNFSGCRSEPPKMSRKTNPITISPDDLCCSELWAGPAYSNSPRPSSLPIPKFSLRQKRSVSLDLPGLELEDTVLPPEAKSAPSSSPRDSSVSPSENLRRILNLDLEN
ncbi:hypothetical protein KSP40_PGU016827 [Platanthera guangdongensis]|uniref:Uncharacterized protein n=1 Tax=Platanthera guangdongensis TaxID=2320717 RepID=A0ABR2MKE1_9ASPA